MMIETASLAIMIIFESVFINFCSNIEFQMDFFPPLTLKDHSRHFSKWPKNERQKKMCWLHPPDQSREYANAGESEYLWILMKTFFLETPELIKKIIRMVSANSVNRNDCGNPNYFFTSQQRLATQKYPYIVTINV